MSEKYKLSEEQLNVVYEWVDQFKLSKPKRNISRDFSDAVLMAEVAKVFYPRLVDIHNYTPSNAVSKKIYNWQTLNSKVFAKDGFHIGKEDIEHLSVASVGAIEWLLLEFKGHVEKKKEEALKNPEPPQQAEASPPKKQTPVVQPGRLKKEVSNSNLSSGSQPRVAVSAPLSQNKNVKQRENEKDLANVDGDDNSNSQVDLIRLSQIQSLEKRLNEMTQIVEEFKSAVEALEEKVQKQEQIIRLKDTRIQSLTLKLQQAGIM